jgi:hypothetical protein
MKSYSRSHLSDPELLHSGSMRNAAIRAETADFLADVAEIDVRQLDRQRGHDSMIGFCEIEWGLSPDAAYKRIQAARKARQFPAIFPALADGRLHLTAVNLLAPYLIAENADELLAAAAGKTKSQIELLLAERFPRTEAMPLTIAASPQASEEPAAGARIKDLSCQLAPAQVGVSRSRITPIAADRFVSGTRAATHGPSRARGLQQRSL